MPTPKKPQLPKIDPAVDLSAEEEALANAPIPPKTKPAPVPVPEPEPVKEERPVLYPLCTVARCKDPYPSEDSDAPALVAEDAMTLLDWQTEPRGGNWGSNFLLLDGDGNKVRCLNNEDNRRFTKSWAERLAQDLLRGNWRFNGESYIIGKTGRTLSCQHRLIGLPLAQQQLNKNPLYWKQYWPDGIVRMPALLVYGIDESDDVTRTHDNVKPRTLADVFFTSNTFRNWGDGRDVTIAERSKLSAMLDVAVKLCWERTGAKRNVWVRQRTHSESLDFANRHPRLVDAVHHVFAEDTDGKISKVVGPGYAAGILYLMACGKTSHDQVNAYVHPGSERNQDQLNLDLWEKAEEFFTLLAGDPTFEPVRWRIGSMKNTETGFKAPADEILGVLAKAWMLYLSGEKFKEKDQRIKLKYRPHDTDPDATVVDEWPTVGGIDFGPDGDPENGGVDVDVLIQETVEAIESEESTADPVDAAKIEAGKAAAKVANGHAGAGTDDGDGPPVAPPAPPKPKVKPGTKPPATPAGSLLTDEDKAQLEKLKTQLAKPVVNGEPTPAPKKQPTAAESLAKQKAADAEAAKAKNKPKAPAPKPKAAVKK